jgi:hypothetical protein
MNFTPTVLTILITCIGFCFQETARGQETFEGSLTYEIAMQPSDQEAQGMKNEVDFYIKGSKTLIKNERANKAYNFKMLIERKDQAFYILLERNDRKVAMKQDLSTVKMWNNSDKESEEQVEFEKTNDQKEIKGYECTRYKVNQEQFTGSAWITKELSLKQEMEAVFGIMQQHPKNKHGAGAISASNFPEEGVVMASSLEAKDGDRMFKSQMKEVEEKTVKADRFDISHYRIMNMTGTSGSFGN